MAPFKRYFNKNGTFLIKGRIVNTPVEGNLTINVTGGKLNRKSLFKRINYLI